MPGQIVASEEEYISGPNTTLDTDGNIRALVIGTIKIDSAKKEISIAPIRKIKIELGDIVYGKVFDVKEKMVLILVNRVYSKEGIEKRNYVGMTALFVSNITNGYLENIRDSAKIGDIICGEIIKMDNGIVDISTKKNDYGVVLGYSVFDRSVLKLTANEQRKDIKELSNQNISSSEKRKVSSNYIC